MNFIKTIFFCGIFFAPACHSPQKSLPSQFDFGNIEKNIYSNEFFDMRIEFPPDWHLVSAEEMEAYQKAAMEEQLKNDPILSRNNYVRNITETAINNYASLLSVYKYKTEDDFVLYPSFILHTFNTKGDGLDQTAKGYLFDLKVAKKREPGELEVAEEFYWKNMGKEKYDALWWINYNFDTPIMHEVFARKKEDLLLLINITYSTQEEKNELHTILDRIQKLTINTSE